MVVHHLKQSQVLPISMDQAWEFFSTPRNLDQITPDDIGLKITYLAAEHMYAGQIITYKVMIMPHVWVPWVTEITQVDAGKSFVDQQLSGPYKLWHHRHTFEPHEDGVLMTDLVHYSIGFSLLGELAHKLFVKSKLEHIFRHRRDVLEQRFSGRPLRTDPWRPSPPQSDSRSAWTDTAQSPPAT